MANDDNIPLNRRERAALSPAKRQSIIKNLFVEHDRFKDAITAIGSFHMPVEGGDPDFGVLTTLCGDSRTGKTFTLERYAKRFPASDGTRGVIRRVVYCDMPIDCNLRAMAEQIADALNFPHSQRLNTRGLVGAVLLEIKKQAVEFLILDEFQEAFDVSRKKNLRDARGFLRKILNLRSLNVCAAGLVETYELLAADAKLKGRGLLPHHLLHAYEWDDPADQKLFRLLCASIDDRLPFRENSNLGSIALAQRLYWVTDGVIGILKEFLFAAACRAMNADADRIEMHFLADAWDVRKPIGQTFNPFVDDLKDAPSKEEQTLPKPPRNKFDDGIFSKK
ncbi:AAA domain-containing protein [Bradyrhizobium sp. NFR13]|uniref:ATP-binding protein n=1 Tax=Bradyrhizobium sp. NFR13 TaxID=1566285 RepID=UPI0008F1F4E4|nr:ATP-binding protein [Bradyrhizobium sp. NFR13]SFM13664.1 AAA domain-containing protein [Bradyrhizobium sp. NFR13]